MNDLLRTFVMEALPMGWSPERIAGYARRQGIAVSTKSACREGEESRSHAVAALGGEEWRAENTLRFSLGRETSARDMKRVAQALKNIISGCQTNSQRGM